MCEIREKSFLLANIHQLDIAFTGKFVNVIKILQNYTE